MSAQDYRYSSAVKAWKELYTDFKDGDPAMILRDEMRRFSREAALERQVAALQRQNEAHCYTCGCRKSEHDSDCDERRPNHWCNGKNGECDCARFVDVEQELDNTLDAFSEVQRTIAALQRQNARLQELLNMANYAVWRERL